MLKPNEVEKRNNDHSPFRRSLDVDPDISFTLYGNANLITQHCNFKFSLCARSVEVLLMAFSTITAAFARQVLAHHKEDGVSELEEAFYVALEEEIKHIKKNCKN